MVKILLLFLATIARNGASCIMGEGAIGSAQSYTGEACSRAPTCLRPEAALKGPSCPQCPSSTGSFVLAHGGWAGKILSCEPVVMSSANLSPEAEIWRWWPVEGPLGSSAISVGT